VPILVGISGCLLGERVRYDGDHKRSRYCTDELSRYVQYIKICPEVAAGMSVPRPTIRLERHANEIRAVIPTTGADVTAALTHVADRQYHQLGQLSGYVLCTKSPSCGIENVKLFNPTTGEFQRVAQGLFARRLQELFPALPITEDVHLEQVSLRENFILRLYVYAVWRQLRLSLNHSQLALFHESVRGLLTLQQPAYQRLTNMLAADTDEFEELGHAYSVGLMQALAKPSLVKHSRTALLPLQTYIEQQLPHSTVALLTQLALAFLPEA